MIEFMVLGAPRSGTAWASAWLSTDTTLCLHEPLSRYRIEDLDKIKSDKILGVSCTALALFPDFVNAHPARKVILHRDPQEVRESLRKINLRGDYDFSKLNQIKGMHCHWQQLFTNPEPIYTHLLNMPFDAERHAELVELNIQNVSLIRKLQERQLALAYA